jgi:transposase-like protein
LPGRAQFGGTKVEAAVKEVAERFGVGEGTLWEIWREHRDRVETELKTGRL